MTKEIKKRKIICDICGSEFEASHSQAKYCSKNCVRIGERKSWNKYSCTNRLKRRLSYRKYYEENKENVAKKVDKYQKTEAGIDAAKKTRARQKVVNSEKVRAREILYCGVMRGEVIKKPCEVCDDAKVQGHHEDYSKPLDVKWLCVKHHAELHKKERMRELQEKIKEEENMKLL